jgi:hypothetical protein
VGRAKCKAHNTAPRLHTRRIACCQSCTLWQKSRTCCGTPVATGNAASDGYLIGIRCRSFAATAAPFS